MNNYIVATSKPWNIEAYNHHSKSFAGKWYLVNSPDMLQELLTKVSPKYIFFPHWSWLVPQEITSKYECVCFHMTDVPYGRGGSPLQNLIILGHTSTKLSALRMLPELDAGPVYYKIDMSLVGSAQYIYEDMADKVYDIISYIVENEVIPSEQKGEVVKFERRTPDQSAMPEFASLSTLYDHIRMLDAETYPHTFIKYGDFKLEFTEAQLDENELVCKVSIKKDV